MYQTGLYGHWFFFHTLNTTYQEIACNDGDEHHTVGVHARKLELFYKDICISSNVGKSLNF